MSQAILNQNRFLIIGGVPKAGTTSLFNYLADHPEICPSEVKETRFFLEEEYPLYARYTYGKDALDTYAGYFSDCQDNRIRMEASPQYLHSEYAADGMRATFGDNLKLVFILRDPIERLISYYRFSIQVGRHENDYSFQTFLDEQYEDMANGHAGEEEMRALVNGRYTAALERYIDLFGRENILILDFSKLRKNAVDVLKEIAQFLEIDPEFYNNFEAKTFNKTQQMKWRRVHQTYKRLSQTTSERLSSIPIVWENVRRLERQIRPIYMKLNRAEPKPVVLSDDLRAQLTAFYAEDQAALQNLLAKENG